MKSIKSIYKIGFGPSSSHTMGPSFATKDFLKLCSDADFIKVILYGSLAKTGKGHGTDRALLGGMMGFRTDDERIRDSFEIAEKETYYVLRKARNDEAGQKYLDILEEESDGLYIRDIIRGGISNDDPRIPGNLSE